MLPENTITHVCCCGAVLYRELSIGVNWLCSKCSAKWLQTNKGMKLQMPGNKSCYDCYRHDFKNGSPEQKPTRGYSVPLIIATSEAQKEYIITHCRHARNVMGAV